MANLSVVIVHEFNGRKYFEAVSELKASDKLGDLRFVDSSVLKQFVRNIFRDKLSFKTSVIRAFRNQIFRLQLPFLRDKIYYSRYTALGFSYALVRYVSQTQSSHLPHIMA